MSYPIVTHDQPATETNETTKTDGTPARRIFRFREMLTMPRGIEMKGYVHSDGSITFIGQYYNKKNQQPNSRPKRVYKIELTYRPEILFGQWAAKVVEDETTLVSMSGDSKWTVAYAALGALRGILHRRCVSTSGNRLRRRKAAALNPVNPVNPVQNKEVA